MNQPTPTLDPATAQAAYQAGQAIGGGVIVFIALSIIGGIVFAVVCALMARSRGRNVGGAIAIGFFFGILGVLYYAIAGDTVESRVAKEQAARALLRS